MSGPIIHTKKINRRQFVNRLALSGAGVGLLSYSAIRLTGWQPATNTIRVTSHNLDQKAHLIRKASAVNSPGGSPEVAIEEKVDVAIIGAGISGLTVGYHLKKSGYENFKIFEMNTSAGGNSDYFSSADGKGSWGAHYLPIIRNDDPILKKFLIDQGIIVGEKDNLPIYNEEYLCLDPHERLLVRGHWQDSLIPDYGLDSESARQISEFHKLTSEFKNKKGRDGKSVFSIPVDDSSQDPEFLKLDQMSFKEFLDQKKWNSEAIQWYANYACQDDFGTSFENTSAWAGLHYFSARNGKAANTEEQSVVTWPEGNGFLSEALQKSIKDKIQLNSSVQNIERTAAGFKIRIQDLSIGSMKIVEARKVIYCLPRFTASYVINNATKPEAAQYYPWLIAHVAVKRNCLEKNHHLSWDTVKFLEKDLGYINNHHQYLTQDKDDVLITFYYAFTEGTAKENRTKLSTWTEATVKDFVVQHLKKYHPDIESNMASIDYRILGHGMISPSIDFLWSKRKQQLPREHNGILFAHSDMSGISIFEEAFHQGYKTFLKLKESL